MTWSKGHRQSRRRCRPEDSDHEFGTKRRGLRAADGSRRRDGPKLTGRWSRRGRHGELWVEGVLSVGSVGIFVGLCALAAGGEALSQQRMRGESFSKPVDPGCALVGSPEGTRARQRAVRRAESPSALDAVGAPRSFAGP